MNILESRRRMLGAGVYKKTVTGNPAIAQGSLARMYPGIEMQGWTEQDSTTGAQLFDASGKEVNSSTFIPFPVAVTDGKYTLSTNANKSSAGNSFVFFSGGNVTSGGDGVYEGKSVTVDSVDGYVTILMRKIEGIDPIKNFEIMLNAGTTAKPYEPYTGGVPSPSPDYPQEIVSSGTQNQENGKWEYEITITNAQTDPDKNQTVTLTADRPLTKWDKLTKKNGVWGWEYKSAEAVLDGSEEWSLYPDVSVGIVFYTAFPNALFGLQTSLCDKYRNINNVWSDKYNGVFGIYSDHDSEPYKYFRPPSAVVETVEQWKDWLSENLLTLWYETEAETFVPLTASEQEQMNNLYTYRPTTVLSNQQDCEMALTYKTRKSMEVTA